MVHAGGSETECHVRVLRVGEDEVARVYGIGVEAVELGVQRLHAET